MFNILLVILLPSEDYYTWLIEAVTNQEPRKTIGYCFENKRLLFSKSKMVEVIFSQSGGELRIQDGAIGSDTLSSSEAWKLGPRFP